MVLVEVFYYFILYRNIIVLRIKNETVFGTRNVTTIMFQFHVSRWPTAIAGDVRDKGISPTRKEQSTTLSSVYFDSKYF